MPLPPGFLATLHVPPPTSTDRKAYAFAATMLRGAFSALPHDLAAATAYERGAAEFPRSDLTRDGSATLTSAAGAIHSAIGSIDAGASAADVQGKIAALAVLAERIEARASSSAPAVPATLGEQARRAVERHEETIAAAVVEEQARAEAAERRETALSYLLENPAVEWFERQSRAIKLVVGAAAAVAALVVGAFVWRSFK